MNGGLSMAEMKSGYKMTDIGVIPEDWEVKEFNETFSVIPNNSLSRDYLNTQAGEYHDIHYGDVLIKYGALLDAGNTEIPFINKAITDKWVNRRIVTEGDIIMADTAEDNTVGKCSEVINVNHKKIVSGLHTFWLHPNEGLFEKGFLGYFMSHSLYHNQLLPLIHGTKVSSVSKNEILGTRVLVPLKNEQTAIATALSDVDSLISALTKKIEKKKAIKQGLMQQLLTGKKRLLGYKGLALVKNEKMEYPGDWDVVKLGDLCRIITKQTGFDYSATIKPSLRTSRGLGVLPFIQNKDFEGYKINFNTDFYIPKDVAMHFPQILLDEPSLLVSISGRIGNVGYYLSSKLAFIGGAICVAKFWKKEYIPWVMLYLQSSKGQNEIFMNEKAGAQHNITVEAIRNFRIPMPSMSEQTAIANILSDCDSEIAALEEKRDKYKEIKQGMMQQLLTGKIRLIK